MSPLDTPAPASSILPGTDSAAAPTVTTPEPTVGTAADEASDATDTTAATDGATSIGGVGGGILLARAAMAGASVSAAVVVFTVF